MQVNCRSDATLKSILAINDAIDKMRVIGIFGVHRTPTSRIHEQSIQTFSIHHRISIIFIYTHLKIKMENTYIFESQEEMAEFNNIQDLATAETYLYDNSISQKLSTKRK